MFSRLKSAYINNQISYSQLINFIKEGRVESIILSPENREVLVRFNDGSMSKVPVFYNDQTLLSTIEDSGTPLEVVNLSKYRSNQSLLAYSTIGIIFIFIFIFILSKSLKIANKSLSFLTGKNSVIDPSTLNTTFQDIAAIPEALDEIKEIIDFLNEPDKFIKIGATIPKGFLLVGPPGTGKTLLAKAIAGEADVPFFSVSASEFVELFVGIGATRVKNLFTQARNKSPSIIFIDEIDSIGRQRGFGVGGGNDEREQTLNQLLTEMDGFPENSGVIIIGATNRPDILDKALTRAGRFDRRIEIDLPDKKGRLDILSLHGLSKPLANEVDLNIIANKTTGFSGAELANLLNEAAILTARQKLTKVGLNQIEEALDRKLIGIQLKVPSPNNSLKIIAYNEIGIALLSLLISDSDKITKISIFRNTTSITNTSILTPPEDLIDSGFVTRKYLMSKLILTLGGRATEELVFGKSELTQFSRDHIKRATLLAREMVLKYGFSNLGVVNIDSNNNKLSYSNLFRTKPVNSNVLFNSIDKEVSILIHKSLRLAKSKLQPHLSLIDVAVEKLIEEEIISINSFKELMKSII